MGKCLRFVSVNIEGDKHLEKVIPFLQKQRPDVFCLQELQEQDIPLFEEELGVRMLFRSMDEGLKNKKGESLPPRGIGIGSALPLLSQESFLYKNMPQPPVVEDQRVANDDDRIFLIASFDFEDEIYTIGTTHFTWSMDGESTPEQLHDMAVMLEHLKDVESVAFAGDFNAPRGGATFAELSSKYKDNIPPSYTTSIDGNLHRAGHLERMVDGLFTTPDYEARGVELVPGISDHCAILATICKRVE